MRPNLPEEPTAEQFEAWIELADLVVSDCVTQRSPDSLARWPRPGHHTQ
jgi:hypothetical protein